MLKMFLPKTRAVNRTTLLLGALIIFAWGMLITWQRSSYAGLLGHEALADHHIPFAVHLFAFQLSWLLMIMAMMLPVSLASIVDSLRHRLRSSWAAAQVVLGYLTPWILFGMVAFLGDSILHELSEHGGPLEMVSSFIAPVILLATGIYQLTPLKRRFTELCRLSPNIHMEGAFSCGLLLGKNCIGSCWSLMLLMFALGHHQLEWMLILGGIGAAERLTSWGPRLAQFVGLALIVWAAGSMLAGV